MSELQKYQATVLYPHGHVNREYPCIYIADAVDAHIADLKAAHVEDLARTAGDQLARDAYMYNLAEEVKRLREAMQQLKKGITDQAECTVWFSEIETAVDFIDRTLGIETMARDALTKEG